MAYYDDYFPEYRRIETPLVPPAAWPVPRPAENIHRQRMLFILLAVVALSLGFAKLTPGHVAQASASNATGAETAPATAGENGDGLAQVGSGRIAPGTAGELSPVFTPEVQYWAPKIMEWSASYGVDPNLAAIIMQIESCGDQGAVSHAGAQGLFQVMPFHFAAGEEALDPDTNARRGLNYFVERLNQTTGDVGRAFAGYNGGHVAAASAWESWPDETQRYYRWSTGIYNDIQSGLSESPTLQAWLQAGGASLCRQAATRIGLQ